jgi:putative PIN family toxin of toxin-antitoxin system
MTSNKLRIVLDTNVLLVTIPSYSKYHWLFQALISKKFDLFITNDILNEYEEIIEQRLGHSAAYAVIRALMEFDNVFSTVVYYKFQLIVSDPDDDKFVDCAFAGNAHYLVTNDTHFNVIKNNVFPKINIISLQDFEKIIL